MTDRCEHNKLEIHEIDDTIRCEECGEKWHRDPETGCYTTLMIPNRPGNYLLENPDACSS